MSNHFVIIGITLGYLIGNSLQTGRCEEVAETVTVFGQQVPVGYVPQMLITGVDIVTLVNSVVPDIDTLVLISSGKGGSSTGTGRHWLSDDKRRFVTVSIGVFSSQRAAVEAYAGVLIAAVPRLDPLRPNDPGYLSWTAQLSTGKTFVRDNALVSVQVSKEFDVGTILDAIDQSVLQGINGVERGAVLVQPQIMGNHFPRELIAGPTGMATATLPVKNPDNREIYRWIWVNRQMQNHRGQTSSWIWNTFGIDLTSRKNDPMYCLSRFEWAADDEVSVKLTCEKIQVELTAYLVTDRCVMADPWKKKVNLSGK